MPLIVPLDRAAPRHESEVLVPMKPPSLPLLGWLGGAAATRRVWGGAL
jgi:hypothetical protein